MAPDSSVPIRYFSVLENTEQNEANVLLLCSTRLHRLSLVVGTKPRRSHLFFELMLNYLCSSSIGFLHFKENKLINSEIFGKRGRKVSRLQFGQS